MDYEHFSKVSAYIGAFVSVGLLAISGGYAFYEEMKKIREEEETEILKSEIRRVRGKMKGSLDDLCP